MIFGVLCAPEHDGERGEPEVGVGAWESSDGNRRIKSSPLSRVSGLSLIELTFAYDTKVQRIHFFCVIAEPKYRRFGK